MNREMKMLHMSALMMATGLLIATTANAAAQQVRNCGPRPQVVERLTSNYGETRQSIGLGANNSLIEVYASPSTGSWTITMTRADGLTCLIASGQSYETLVEALPNSDSEA